MRDLLTELLISPSSGAPLRPLPGAGNTVTGWTDGAAVFPIRDGVIQFVSDDDFATSFGYQWNRFDVVRPAEDEEIFRVKIGVEPDSLRGKRVLDAGCGGGRYSLVAARHGADVLGIDRSGAARMAVKQAEGFPNAAFAQADLANPPVRDAGFDLVYSIGVLHHSPDPAGIFARIARLVRPGGVLSVWVYRRNHWWQEKLNDWLRRRALAMSTGNLERLCERFAVLGGIPLLRSTLNKVVNFSNHPDRRLRVCDNFDWYSPRYQSHHEPDEVRGWFEKAGFRQVRELPPQKVGPVYRWAFEGGLIIGSGVNMTGRAPD